MLLPRLLLILLIVGPMRLPGKKLLDLVSHRPLHQAYSSVLPSTGRTAWTGHGPNDEERLRGFMLPEGVHTFLGLEQRRGRPQLHLLK
jgi:hypothetical protein